MKIGIGVREPGKAGFAGLIAEVKRAEAAGFASAWFANIFGLDALTAIAMCGRETTRIELGTAVVPTYPRHPFAMAQQAMTTQLATGNRLVLGIGLSHQVVIEMMLGMSYAKSYSHMKEYLGALAPLVREGRVSFKGELFKVNAQLSVPGATPPPIVVAALAPKMLALAGSVADGTITWMTGQKTLAEHIVPSIRKAAAAAGRPTPRVIAGLPVAVTDRPDQARAAVAGILRSYGGLPSYRAMLDREGAQGAGEIAVVGNEAAVAEQLDQLAASGVTDLNATLFPVPDEDAPARTFEFLAARAKA
ncbi:MAG: TIGR03564 family F420-dependent LLM class oxidoreductase [Polyangiales bacterium]